MPTRCGWVALLVGALGHATIAFAQAPDSLPFGDGERLTFTVRAPKLGRVGHAVMAVVGPADVRGVETTLLSWNTDFHALFMHSTDAHRSWTDLGRMTSLRFSKHERRPFSSDDDSVEIHPDLGRWSGMHGDSGTTTGPAPLDELAFIYFLRTVSFVADSTYLFDRHYDRRRAPTTVRLVKREVVRTPAGEFNAAEIEIRLKIGRDFKSEWKMRMWISEDRCRLPVRIESTVPILGAGVMTLDSAVTPTCVQAAGPAVPGRTKEAALTLSDARVR